MLTKTERFYQLPNGLEYSDVLAIRLALRVWWPAESCPPMTIDYDPDKDNSRARLAKVLPLLASDKAGEVVAAAAAVQRILKAAGLSWDDILVPAPTPTPVPHRPPPWRATCAELAKRPGSLRRWEIGFVASLPAFHRISEKQRRILDEIARRVLGEQP